MSRMCLRAFLASTTFLIGLHGALAQEETDTDEQAVAETGTQNGDVVILDKITIFGNRQATKPLDVPANITVIDGEVIDDRFITDMQELVRYEPGVNVNRQTSGADPFNTFGGFQIRGVSGNRVQMLVDGSRVPERIIDGTRDYLDFNFTKQVDIVRGPGSVLWGADALGGIVALETIDPEDVLVDGKTKGGSIEFGYDSLDNEFNTALTYAQELSPDLSILGGVSYTSSNEATLSNARADGGIYGCPRNVSLGATPCNELDPTDKKNYRGLAKAVYTPNGDHRFELTAEYMRRKTDVQYDQILGPNYSTSMVPTGETTYDYDRELDLYRAHFAIEHEWHVGSPLVDDVKWSFAYTPNGYERTGTEFKENAGGEDVIEEDFLSYDEDFFELDVQLTSRFDTGGIGHTVTWGFDGDRTLTDYQRIDNIYNVDTDTETEERGGGFNFANATTVRADFFIQDQIALFDERLEITPGLRYAYYNLDPRPDPDYQEVPGSEPVPVERGTTLFAIGANYNLTEEYSVYAAFNQGFKMPTAQQLYTSLPGTGFNLIPAPDLRPESVDNYEVGVRGEFDRGYFSVTAFYADYTDFIQSFYFVPGTFFDITYHNLSSVQMYGVEAAAAWDLTDNLRADLSLTWQEGKQQDEPGDAWRPFTAPPLKGVIGLSYTMPEYDLTLDAVTTLVAPVTRTSSADAFKPDGYGLLDLYAKWKPTENSELRFGVQNVFDQRYFQDAASSYDNVADPAGVALSNPIELQTGPGRTFQAGYKVTF